LNIKVVPTTFPRLGFAHAEGVLFYVVTNDAEDDGREYGRDHRIERALGHRAKEKMDHNRINIVMFSARNGI